MPVDTSRAADFLGPPGPSERVRQIVGSFKTSRLNSAPTPLTIKERGCELRRLMGHGIGAEIMTIGPCSR